MSYTREAAVTIVRKVDVLVMLVKSQLELSNEDIRKGFANLDPLFDHYDSAYGTQEEVSGRAKNGLWYWNCMGLTWIFTTVKSIVPVYSSVRQQLYPHQALGLQLLELHLTEDVFHLTPILKDKVVFKGSGMLCVQGCPYRMCVGI